MGIVMEKHWFLYLNDEQEGPYSLLELRKDDRLNPETFAWREGMSDWKRIVEIPELSDLFSPDGGIVEDMATDEDGPTPPPNDELVLELGKHPFHFAVWLLIAGILIFYIFYEYFWWN